MTQQLSTGDRTVENVMAAEGLRYSVRGTPGAIICGSRSLSYIEICAHQKSA
jgi:hypothetical protein